MPMLMDTCGECQGTGRCPVLVKGPQGKRLDAIACEVCYGNGLVEVEPEGHDRVSVKCQTCGTTCVVEIYTTTRAMNTQSFRGTDALLRSP